MTGRHRSAYHHRNPHQAHSQQLNYRKPLAALALNPRSNILASNRLLIDDSRRERFHFLKEDLEFDIKPWLVEHILNVDKNLAN